MIKYVDYDIVFQEVPGEISLALNISNCPYRCDGCHSPHLQKDIGRDLEEDLPLLLDKYKDMISCVLFLGEGNDRDAYRNCAEMCHKNNLKLALYTGGDGDPTQLNSYELLWFADAYCAPYYIKFGPYKKELGGLSSPSTNQRMYRWNDNTNTYNDITNLFHRQRFT